MSLRAEQLTGLSEALESRPEPAWLKELRRSSLRLYADLPLEPSPLYVKYVEPQAFDPSRLEPSWELPQEEPEFIRRLEEQVPGPLFIFIDGYLVKVLGGEELEARGVKARGLRALVSEDEQEARALLAGALLRPDEDKAAALAHALFADGLVLQVPANVQLERPLYVLTLQKGARGFFTRDFVRVGEGASVTLVWEAYAVAQERAGTVGQALEVEAGPNSEVNIVCVQDFPQNTHVLLNRTSFARRDARVRWMLGHFGGEILRSRLVSALRGEGSSTECFEVSFSRGAQRFDLRTLLLHERPYTRSLSMSRSIARQSSAAVLKGLIKILNEAKYSDSYLGESAMVLDKGARIDPIPSLEIATNEVRATHAGSVAQLDEEQIFYLMARGFSREEASLMLVQAFFEPLIQQIPLLEARRKMRRLISERWQEMGQAPLIEAEEPLQEAEARHISLYDVFQTHYKYRPTK
jgi:Fe-S cluster assembly protein SufB/Fe-S cluster assembly protein SufD